MKREFNPYAIDKTIEIFEFKNMSYSDFQYIFYHWIFWSLSSVYNTANSSLRFFKLMDRISCSE